MRNPITRWVRAAAYLRCSDPKQDTSVADQRKAVEAVSVGLLDSTSTA